MPTPHAHSLRNISYLHASRLPFKRAFTFASAHAPESLHNCARSSRDAHLASSSLHYTQTAMFPAPSAPPSAPQRAMFGAHGSDHVSQQNITCYRRAAIESKIGASCVNHTLVSQGWTAVECTPRTSASADPPLTATRGGSGPITSLPRYRQEATLRPFVTRTMSHLNHGAMLHLNHGGGRAPAVYCDNMERIARRQGATREEEHFPQMSLGTVARRPLRAPRYRPTTRSEP